MKRNMDLVRDILLSIEESGSYKHLQEKYPGERVKDHVRLMMGGNLVVVDYHMSEPLQLRWHGYEFLDKIRDEKRWVKIKKKLERFGYDFSYEMVTQVTVQMSTWSLGHIFRCLFGF